MHQVMSLPKSLARSLRLQADHPPSPVLSQPRRHQGCLGRRHSPVVCAAKYEGSPKGNPSQSAPEQAAAPSSSAAGQEAQGAEPPIVEATNVFEPDEEYFETPGLPRMPDTVAQQAVIAYTALAATHLIQGVGLAVAAWHSPELLLPGVAAGPVGSMLLGCTAAMSVMASGLLLHLWVTTLSGELGTWRHQRINAALALYGAVVFMSTAWAATSSHPILTGALLATSLACTAACSLVARSCWPHQPWLQWSVVPGDVAATWTTFKHLLGRDVSTVAGVACLAWMAVAALGAPGVLLDPMSWGLDGAAARLHQVTGVHPFHPYATPAATAAALDALRRACGAGLLLSAVVAHTLLEAATHARTLRLIPYMKETLAGGLNTGRNLALAVLRPDRSRFALLHWFSLLAPTGLLAAFLTRAASLGVDLNRDAMLMAPLHWAAMLSATYFVMAALTLDWNWVMSLAMRVFAFFASIVSFVVQTFVMRLEWGRAHKL